MTSSQWLLVVKTTNKLPQIYSFACLQAKKEQFTCPQVTNSQWLFTRCLFQRIQSHDMNGIQCFNQQLLTRHAAFHKCVYSKEFNHMTWMTFNVSINNFSQDMQFFKDMNMIIKKHNWDKLVGMTDIKEGSSTKASRSLFHSSTSV